MFTRKEKKKIKILLIILVIDVIGIMGELFYFRDVFIIDDNDQQDNEQEVVANIEIGSIGEKAVSYGMICNDIECGDNSDSKVYINENGKVTYEYSAKGIINVDSTINEKVINIALGYSCDGSDKRLVALTDKGNIYYNQNTLLDYQTGDYKLDFIKIESDYKILGLESKMTPAPTTCSTKQIFAYIDSDTKLQINSITDELGTHYELGESWDTLYPYTDSTGNIVYGPIYYIRSNKMVTFNTNNNFIKIDNKKIKVDKLIINYNDMIETDLLNHDYLLSTDNKLYEINYKDRKGTDYEIQLYSDLTVDRVENIDKKTTVYFNNGTTLILSGEYDIKIC